MSDESPSQYRLVQRDVVSLGMVVLDELRFPDRDTLHDVPGGSGTYATLGARLVTICVACIIMVGDDFPDAVLDEFSKWHLTLVTRKVPGEKSTRGLLEYLDADFGHKTFRYLTPPLQPTVADLEATSLLGTSAFHILSTPSALQMHVRELRARRAHHDLTEYAKIVWEPFPPHCVTANLEAHVEACRDIDVFSPNHLELAALFYDRPEDSFRQWVIESYAVRFRNRLLQKLGKAIHIVVRAGEHGCFFIFDEGGSRWLPPYYELGSHKVVDPTGAGNTFLGAVAAVLERGCSLFEAACFGTVAASFAVEQIGLPKRGLLPSGDETWNGDRFTRRLGEYMDRVR